MAQLTNHKGEWILLDSRLYLTNHRVNRVTAFNCMYVPEASQVRLYLEWGEIDYWTPRIEGSTMYGVEVPLTELRLYNSDTEAVKAAQRIQKHSKG
jgi:hypothetical protein